jgi:hypothetical protein
MQNHTSCRSRKVSAGRVERVMDIDPSFAAHSYILYSCHLPLMHILKFEFGSISWTMGYIYMV